MPQVDLSSCPLCATRVQGKPLGRDVYSFSCPKCGDYGITSDCIFFKVRNATLLDKHAVSAYVKERTIRSKPVTLFSGNPEGSNLSEGSTNFDMAMSFFPRSVSERLDRTLLNLAALTTHLGKQLTLETTSYLLGYGFNVDEMLFIVHQLMDEELVSSYQTKRISLPASVMVTPRGMNRAADLERGLYGPLNEQVFVAMSFHESLEEAYEKGIKLGIEDCGYHPLKVDLKEHNENITDVILAELRRSKFIVADFTRQKKRSLF